MARSAAIRVRRFRRDSSRDRRAAAHDTTPVTSATTTGTQILTPEHYDSGAGIGGMRKACSGRVARTEKWCPR